MSISVLSDDDLVNIFIKLPAKTLQCLKCVCKSWYTIINSPDFISLHYDQSNLHIILRTPILRMCDFVTFDIVTEIKYRFKYLDEDASRGFLSDVPFELVGSCRGLLYFNMSYKPFTSFLYNPTTQSEKFLPYLRWRCSSFPKAYFGLGYDSSTDDYKCVRILLGKSKDELGSFKSQVMVYSLRDDNWRPGAHEVPFYFLSLNKYFMYFNGFLHELNFENYNGLNTPRNIICFDVTNESFSSLALPSFHSGAYRNFLIGVLDDRLCLTFNHSDQYSEFWVMNEYGREASWAMKYRLMEPNMSEMGRPISFFKSTNKLFLAFERKIAYKDLETSESRDVVLSNNLYVNGYISLMYADVCPENLLMLTDDVVDEPAGEGEQRGENRNRKWLINETRRVFRDQAMDASSSW